MARKLTITESQRKLLVLMARGYTPIIYRDDPRTRYVGPGHFGIKGNASVVVALLNKGLLEVAHHEPDRHDSSNGKLIGGSIKYRLTDKGREVAETMYVGDVK